MVIKAISERRAKNKKEGWYKRAPIAALRRAKFHLPRQAAAPQYTSRRTRDIKSKNSKIYIAAMAAVHKPQYMRKKKVSCVLRLMYCGSYIFEGSIAAVHDILFSSSCTAAPRVLQKPE